MMMMRMIIVMMMMMMMIMIMMITIVMMMIMMMVMVVVVVVVVAPKGNLRSFLIALRTTSNKYAQVAWIQRFANHVQHIGRLSRAAYRVPREQLSY